MSKVVTRFAPSPTGTLHIGGVRTALFNYIYAKQTNGEFLVRIEDTDRERSTKAYEKNILDTLSSIGLSPDKKPINQSERKDIYIKAAEQIIASGDAYWCVIVLKKNLKRCEINRWLTGKSLCTMAEVDILD